MEDILNHLKFLNMLSPRGVHIPNCDKKGFYKKKQVSAASEALSLPPSTHCPLTHGLLRVTGCKGSNTLHMGMF